MEMTLQELALMLYNIEAVKFGDFKTKIGLNTPVYFDIRVVISHPAVMSTLANELWKFAKTDDASLVCGVPYTALPLATLISVENTIPMLIKRKEMKSYGMKKMVEGAYSPGDNCIIIEDVITSGSSILETVDALRKEQLTVTQAFVVVDREQGARENLESHGIRVKSLYTITQLMKYLLEANKITSAMVEKVMDYLKVYQAPIVSAQGISEDRLKLSYNKRAKLAKNSVASRLLELMERKQSNLCLAVDFTDTDKILKVTNLSGPHIAVLKIHVDIIENFSKDFIQELKKLAKQHDFLLMEDRKFGDIGNTVALQYRYGLYKIAEWADLITVHPVAGKPVLEALKNEMREITEPRGVFLVAQMSCEGTLTTGDYVKTAVSMAEEASDLVVGLVCQSNLCSQPGLLQLTPGVKLSKGNDNFGQQYNDPQTVVKAGADLAVVGRGITEDTNMLKTVLEYQKQLWAAYENRVKSK